MSYRKEPLVAGQIYHIFNRSVARQPIFSLEKDYRRFLEVVNFYRFSSPGCRFSFYDRLAFLQKKEFLEKLRKNGERQIEILAFCLMPNHFHFLIKQLVEDGIMKFTANLQNSYAKYFNTQRERNGALFQEKFKAAIIEIDEQFLHVFRYIHLNPFSSFIIKDLVRLKDYRWSSLRSYLGEEEPGFLNKEFLWSFFPEKKKLEDFTFDQADYQRRLAEIKHLVLE